MKLSQRALDTIFERYDLLPKEKRYHGKWSYDIGVVLMGVKIAYEQTKDPKYFDYIKNTMDFYITEDGSIKGYEKDKMNIDYVNNGKLYFSYIKKQVKKNINWQWIPCMINCKKCLVLRMVDFGIRKFTPIKCG